MKIHHFQRYHSEENVETANTMLMLSQLYSYDPRKFFFFLNDKILGEPKAPEVVFDLQTSGDTSVPDAVISQKSFRIAVETSLHNQFDVEQLVGLLDQFEGEEIKVVLTLDSQPMSNMIKEDFESRLLGHNGTCLGSPVRHVNLTFKQLLKAIEAIIDEGDIEILAVFDDFSNYCFEEGLVPDGDKWMRTVAAWQTIQDNLDLCLCYSPATQGYSDPGYIGLYNDKSIQAVGKPQKSIVVTYTNGNPEYTAESDEAVTKDDINRIAEAVQRARKLGHDLTKESQRFFFVEKFFETDFVKTSKYPIRSAKRFDLTDILGQSQMPATEEIAQKLATLTWE